MEKERSMYDGSFEAEDDVFMEFRHQITAVLAERQYDDHLTEEEHRNIDAIIAKAREKLTNAEIVILEYMRENVQDYKRLSLEDVTPPGMRE